jgi:hypothetical protein
MNEHRISNPYDKQYYTGTPDPESQIPKGLSSYNPPSITVT